MSVMIGRFGNCAHVHKRMQANAHNHTQDPVGSKDGSAIQLRTQHFATSHEAMQKMFKVRGEAMICRTV